MCKLKFWKKPRAHDENRWSVCSKNLTSLKPKLLDRLRKDLLVKSLAHNALSGTIHVLRSRATKFQIEWINPLGTAEPLGEGGGVLCTHWEVFVKAFTADFTVVVQSLNRQADSCSPGLQPARLLCHRISQTRILGPVVTSYNLPKSGIEPAWPPLAGGFFTT